MPDYRNVSSFTRLGFVTFTIGFILLSWIWFSLPTRAGQEETAGNRAIGSFAVVNPENVSAAAPLPITLIAAALTPPASSSVNAEETTGHIEAPSIMQLAVVAQDSAIDGANAAKTTVRDLLTTPNKENPEQKTVAQLVALATPTATPTPEPTPTPTEEEIPLDVPRLNLIPMLPKPAATATELPTSTPTITPTPLPLEPGSLWSTFIPGPSAEVDHFWVQRPFLPSAQNQLASANYQFGSTAYGRYRVHHGLDMSNPLNTPVLAATNGEVIHAGIDDPVLLAPFNNFYGNTVVIRLEQRLPVAGGEVDVFVLYGHLNEVTVSVGQQVKPDDIVGLVGMTGIAIGPHLHVEIRVGSNTYDKSVNPYLWMQPQEGSGVIALRLLTSDGRAWPGARVGVLGLNEGGGVILSRQIDTYLNEEPIGPDPRFGENGAMGSLPAGAYLLVTTINGEQIRKEVIVRASETTFVEIRTQQ